MDADAHELWGVCPDGHVTLRNFAQATDPRAYDAPPYNHPPELAAALTAAAQQGQSCLRCPQCDSGIVRVQAEMSRLVCISESRSPFAAKLAGVFTGVVPLERVCNALLGCLERELS